jgi:GT2 family glycosyltransferase
MLDCTASIVTYKTPLDMLRKTINSFLSNTKNGELHIVDNSPTQAQKLCLSDLPVKYHFYGSNAGYGRGHNKALKECSERKYHIIINPDIVIAPQTIEALSIFMDENPDIGVVSPKVLNEDGSIQYLNKRYPNVFDLFARRFIPKSLHFFIQHRLERYEMKDVGYEQIYDVECISGCFMFCRTEVLKGVDGFDDRYFMYFEDFDLSRKIQLAGYRTVYYPRATVTHLWERASHKSIKMTWVFIVNMSRYFNKWGWKWF